MSIVTLFDEQMSESRAEDLITNLRAEVTRLSGKSGFCLECERLVRKLAELEKNAQDEINRLEEQKLTLSERLEQAKQQVVPEGITFVERGFNCDNSTRLYTPTVTVFFREGSGDRETWIQRDKFAAMLSSPIQSPESDAEQARRKV